MTPEQAARLDDVLSGAARRRREEAAITRAMHAAYLAWQDQLDAVPTIGDTFYAGYLAGMRAGL